MIRFLTAGESHGPGLMSVIEGFPANVPINLEQVNNELFRRQQGYGRGGRMRIEQDEIEVLSGIRFGKTLGSPIGFELRNKDWKNWAEVMNQQTPYPGREISRPRPGHADLSGFYKYGFDDMRNVLERSSARETAMRVAVGAFVKQFLFALDVQIHSHVLQIGSVKSSAESREKALLMPDLNKQADASPVRCVDAEAEKQMMAFIDSAKSQGDTAGGVVQIVVKNLLPGLGSYVHWDRKLDGQLAGALMSIQAVKGVEIGVGFKGADRPGSEFHDALFFENGQTVHKTNRAGGIEGGMSNGEDIVIQVMMKPIPTLMKPLQSVDMITREVFLAHKERSDITAVPALAVICEAVVAPVIANALMEKFGADALEEIKRSYQNYKEKTEGN